MTMVSVPIHPIEGMLLTVLSLSLAIRAQPIHTFINDQQTNEHIPQINGQILMEPLKPRIGNDVILSCPVRNLGKFKVYWNNLEKHKLLVYQNVVLTENPRIGYRKTSKENLSLWSLIIRNISLSDEGFYMCRISTDPVIERLTFLKIFVAIEFENTFESDSTVEVQEYQDLNISCRANGRPKPTINWRKQEGYIILSNDPYKFQDSVESEVLSLQSVSRLSSGDYFCIASNDLESIRRKLTLIVRFPPTILVPNKVVVGFINLEASLQCIIESSPLGNFSWQDTSGKKINSAKTKKYAIKTIVFNKIKVHSELKIFDIKLKDSGKYSCRSKNSFGETTSTIILNVKEYRIQTTTPFTTTESQPMNDSQQLAEEITRKSQLDVLKDNIFQTNSKQMNLLNNLKQILIIQLILVILVNMRQNST